MTYNNDIQTDLFDKEIINPYHNQLLLSFIMGLNELMPDQPYLRNRISDTVLSCVDEYNKRPESNSDEKRYFEDSIGDFIEKLVEVNVINRTFLKSKNEAGESKVRYCKNNTGFLTLPISFHEKLYLKNMLKSAYAPLFLDDSTITKLKEQLQDIPDLDYSNFVEFRGVGKDPVFNTEYIKCFRDLIKAIREKRMIHFIYTTNNGTVRDNTDIPVKIEFSVISHLFYLSMWSLEGKRPYKANILRIENLEILEEATENDYAEAMQMMEKKKSKYPIVMEITNKKEQSQAIERSALLFSMYDNNEKTTSLDENTIRMEINYYEFDEEEIIDNIMSFGPSIKVLQPDSVIEKIKGRLSTQSRKNI